MARLIKVIKNEFKAQNDQNLDAFFNSHLLTNINKDALELSLKARHSFFIKNLSYLFKSGVYRQTLLGNIALYIGVFLKNLIEPHFSFVGLIEYKIFLNLYR